jgi:hypothetical protein
MAREDRMGERACRAIGRACRKLLANRLGFTIRAAEILQLEARVGRN